MTMTDTAVQVDTTKVERRLSRARTQLLLKHPFFGCIAMKMKMELSTDIPTAATNGKRVLYNPEFVETLSDDELIFLVAHECFHPMLDHCTRRGDRDPMKWNVAADYIINQLLVDSKVGTMPEQGLFDPALYAQSGGTAEGVYGLLPEPPPNGGGGPNGGNGQGQQALDQCEQGGNSDAEVAELEAEAKITLNQAKQAAKAAGKLPADLERLIDGMLEHKVDWKRVLQDFVVRTLDDQRTWQRPARRFLPQGMYLPSRTGEGIGELCIAIDCSGSVTQSELSQYAAELTCIKEDLRPAKMHVIYFDSRVSHHESYSPDDDLNIRAHGGGGTAFSPVFEFIEEQPWEPVATVFLTDMYCSDFGKAPDHPVLWVATTDYNKDNVPFGQTVRMYLED